jgi:hypothetical protein
MDVMSDVSCRPMRLAFGLSLKSNLARKDASRAGTEETNWGDGDSSNRMTIEAAILSCPKDFDWLAVLRTEGFRRIESCSAGRCCSVLEWPSRIQVNRASTDTSYGEMMEFFDSVFEPERTVYAESDQSEVR